MPSHHRMTQPSRSLLSGRPPKRKRTGAELHDLALALGADWTPGDTVQTWINKHEGKTRELSRMVEGGWLWEDIGKAMHLAGITYSTGQPIPPHTLRLKAYLSRNRERARTAADAARQDHPYTPPPVRPGLASVAVPPAGPVMASMRTAPPFDAFDKDGEGASEEPEFKPVILIRYGVRNPPETLPPPKKEPGPAPSLAIDVDAVLARFTGRK